MVRVIRTRDLGLDPRAIGSHEWADGVAYPSREELIEPGTTVTEEELEEVVTVLRQQRGPVVFGKKLA